MCTAEDDGPRWVCDSECVGCEESCAACITECADADKVVSEAWDNVTLPSNRWYGRQV